MIVVTPDPAALGLRDPRYAPRRLTVARRADGSILLHNPTPLVGVFDNALAPLPHWASLAPRRMWLAERAGQSMAIVGHPYLLAGEIGVQEWVAYIGSAEDLEADLALHTQSGSAP